MIKMDRIVTPEIKENTSIGTKLTKFARYWVLPTVVGVAGLWALKLQVSGDGAIIISTVLNMLGIYLIISANELYKKD
jgi:hypothetical protein